MNQSKNTSEKKSLFKRFFLILGISFFFLYLGFGLAVIFWDKLAVTMPFGYRVAFGSLVIVYAFFRFIRFFQK